MKNIILIVIIFAFFSCKCVEETKCVRVKKSSEKKLSDEESAIINDFMNAEFKKEQYIEYKGYEIMIIEESIKKIKNIDTYLYSLTDWKAMNKNRSINDARDLYFLDSLQINIVKSEIEKEKLYRWKISDFKNVKVNLLNYEELRESINKGRYLKGKLIVYLSRPLIIDKNNAFISFDIGKGDMGFYPITHFTVSMKKENDKWIQSEFYEDGVF